MAGWQWLFILEAIPAILLGVVIFLFLDNRVVEAKWLSERERAAVASEIHEEAVSKTHVSIRSVFTSPRVWLFGAIFFGMEMGSYAIGFWQPTIIRQTGVKDAFHIGMLTTVPYTCALICMMFVGRHSDRTRERRWHIIVPNIVAAIGFILCTQAGSNTPIAMFGLVLAVAGVITGLAMFWALPTSFLGGNAAAAGIALINCTGNLGGFFSPTIIGFLKTYAGTLNSGLFLVAACMISRHSTVLWAQALDRNICRPDRQGPWTPMAEACPSMTPVDVSCRLPPTQFGFFLVEGSTILGRDVSRSEM